MKKKNKLSDFELFKKEFIKWQTKFGLIGFTVYFKHEPIEDGFADICINLEGMVATVRLNSALQDKNKPFKHIKKSAKHEAIHLLIARLERIGRSRYTTASEIDESSEELTIKLENLIS